MQNANHANTLYNKTQKSVNNTICKLQVYTIGMSLELSITPVKNIVNLNLFH